MRLSIRDNGRGFDPDEQIADGHFGLIGMRERAEQDWWRAVDQERERTRHRNRCRGAVE